MLNYISSLFGKGSDASATTAAAKDVKTADSSKPKPCCVCKEEKSRRDECMLFSKAADPVADCKPTIESYRACMEGFGFKV